MSVEFAEIAVAPWPSEYAWLDLFAEVAVDPSARFPCARIAVQLCRTFDATACSYAGVVDVGAVGGAVRRDGRSAVPERRATTSAAALAAAVWNAPELGARHRLSLPAAVASAGTLAFVVGRTAPYRPAEQRLAATLCTLLTTLHARHPAAAPPEPVSLTAREHAVLALLAEGLTATAIGRRLQISVRTVHKHLERIYPKLGVTDRLAAVLAARRLGIGW